MKMNILVMEDLGSKSQAIKRLLEDAGHTCNTIFCVSDFRKHVLQRQYDMIVIDLAVPEYDRGEVSIDNGYKAINYLRRTTESIHRPQSIVVLSAYVDEKFIQEINQYGMRAIRYCSTDSKWEKELMEEVEYVSLLSTKKADIVILTAVEIEYEMMKRMFQWEEFDCFDDNYATYNIAEIVNQKGEKLTIISCHPTKMGAIAAANLTTKAINMFKPDCIIMMGIAGGNVKEVKCGDIVVAENAVDYCNGCIGDDPEDEEKILFLPDADIIHATPDIVNIMRKYKSNKSFLRQIRDSTGDLAMERDIQMHIGQMATGPAVIKSSKFAEEYLKKHNKNYLAIDMETYGVYYATKTSSNRSIEYVSIKGISDVADKNKSDEYQPYCALSVCYLVKHYILNDYKKRVFY